ncbi:MAG TPA: LssY C-terminal domain-containing protein [Bryobacteraceae bacterium]|jgi:hypothetical protein
MMPILYLLFSAHALFLQQLPTGTQLNVRLSTTIGSFSSKPGMGVSGVVIAPVIKDGRVLIPAGSIVNGKIRSVTRVGYGVRHERAALGLQFDQVVISGSEPISLPAKLAEVDNARERVTSAGVVQGIRSTGSLSYRVSGYVRTALLWDVHAEMAEWAIKSLVVEMPEPEIYYPAGTELTLKLTAPMAVAAEPESPEGSGTLSEDDITDLRSLATSMPRRTRDPENKRLSDITNVLLIGSREEITRAFRTAGWSEAAPATIRARIGCIRAAAEVHGFRSAPMTNLLLNGKDPDMSWQKGLNDVAKRHHIRIWKQPGMWYGQELWLAAATRDVDFAYMRPGRTFTHEIAPIVDHERDKVTNDLVFTACARPLDFTARPDMPRFSHNGTGDPIATDTRVAILQMNSCAGEAVAVENPDEEPTPDHGALSNVARGGKLQRFVRREIMITRNDLLRTNVYYRSFEASRWVVNYVRYRRRKSSEMRVLLADYGPAGSSPAGVPHPPSLAVKTLR